MGNLNTRLDREYLSSTNLFSLDNAIHRVARAVPSPEKGLLNVNCLSFGSTSNVLKPDKKPTEQHQTFKKPEYPVVPSAVWSGCWPPLPLAGTRFLWYKQNTSLLSDTHHTKFILLVKQDLEEVLPPGEKTLFQTICNIQKSTTGLSIEVTSISGQHSSIYMGRQRGRHATCMHSKLKQQMSDNGQLTQVKRV